MKVRQTYFTKILFWVLFLAKLVYGQEKTDSLKYPFTDQTGGLYLDNPIKVTATYDSDTDLYIIEQKVAGEDIATPIYMTKKEYSDYILRQRVTDHYLKKSRNYDEAYRSQKLGFTNAAQSFIPGVKINSKVFGQIFGGNEITLTPQGYASIDLGVRHQKIDNPQILEQNRTQFDIDLQQRIQMSLLGKIGENLNLRANYDTQAGFAFENRLNLAFRPQMEGSEDNIIQAIEVGNVNMPLRSTLMVGPQSLFGAKGEFKFGKTHVTTVFSEQQSQAKTITTQNGGIVQEFEINSTDYEVNANFYMGDYFLANYDKTLATYPTLATSTTITRLEVWVKNRNNSNLGTRRSIVAVRDLGNNGLLPPKNGTLYDNLIVSNGIRDYHSAVNATEQILPGGNGKTYVVEENMRLLSPSEYTFNAALGTLYLNQPVNEDDVVAISYQLQNKGTYTQVGELSNEISTGDATTGTQTENNTSTIIAKMIKGRGNKPSANESLWNMMMKNVYSLDAISISPEDFRLDIYYIDQQQGLVNYLYNSTTSKNERNLAVENLDRLVQNGNAQEGGDGFFDFVSGVTVDPNNGKIIFTTVEPFNKTLEDYRAPGDQVTKVAYPELYTQIQNSQTGEASANDKFVIKGQYTSSGSDDISLGAINVPEGSVVVTANGQELVEGVDYLVDYTLGTVKVINEAIKQSGVPVNINMEDQGLFNLTKQRFMGVNVEHRFNENFYIGGTVLNYSERSVTPKVNYGAEPVNNTMFGINGYYSNEMPFMTRWLDRLPLIETKAPSHITIQGEAAYLKPGQAKNTNNFSYLDDFEGSQSNISIKDPTSWSLASTPQYNAAFPNGDDSDPTSLKYNDNRVLASWYYIDPVFYSSGGGLSDDEVSNNMSRRVQYREIYPQQDFVEGAQSFIPTFDFSYYPDLKGPYNANLLGNIQDRWAGITRGLNVTNFNEANVEYIEFWLMDPFADGENRGDRGDLILHLGAVSEDILRDGRKLYENGMPISASDTANPVTDVKWGQVPSSQALVYTFDTEGAERVHQDTGYDGLLSSEEGSIYPPNVNPITGNDPAGDDYVYYLDERWGEIPDANSIVERYRYYRNSEGNSPSNSQELTTPLPDVEDANRDFNMDTEESYFEYKIPISNGNIGPSGAGYVVDERSVNVSLENGKSTVTKWYQVRIPIKDNFTKEIGSPNLNNIRFARLIAKGFNQRTTFRFGTFDLVRSDWRRYTRSLDESNEGAISNPNINNFEVGVINIEENSDRYVLPPGVEREEFYNTTSIQAQNEQSLLMQLKALSGNNKDNVRAIYKQSNLDLRRYKRLEMFLHAENYLDANIPKDEEIEVFVRFGIDITENYYEYAKPLIIGPKAIAGMNPTQIWKPENKIDFALQDFVKAKISRDRETNPVLNQRYAYNVSENNDQIWVKGRPTLEKIRFITIGVRNKASSAKNVEIWANELRLSEIDNDGGYAATASLTAQLADVANITASGTIRQAGFGAINEGPTERSQENYKQYAVATTINADKLLPEQWGIKLPVGLGISEEFIDPLFSPIDTDVKFEEAANRDELKKVARDYTKRTSINLLNVRKEKTNTRAKNHFYDIENFSASFTFNKMYHRDFYVENHTTRDMRLGLNYNYSFEQDYKYPFENWKAVHDTASTSKYLLWIKDFNVNLKPSRISFTADIDRRNDEYLYRNVDQYSAYATGTNNLPFDPIYSNNYFFNWQYQVGFDLTKSLKLDFISSTSNIVDHFNDPSRIGGTNIGIWNDLFDTGRPLKYNQQLRLNYKIPFELIPYLDFINGDLTYNATYDWRAPSNQYIDAEGEDQNLGNIIQNANMFTVQGGLNMETLYGTTKWYNDYQERLNKYRSEVGEHANEYQKQADKAKKSKNKPKIKKTKNRLKLKDYLLGLASSLKQFQLNYTSQESTLLPGFLEEPGFFGVGSGSSPSWGFTLGSQADIRVRALRNRWITTSENMVDPYQKQRTNGFGYNANFELLPDLRIDLTGQKDYSKTKLQYGFNLVEDAVNGNYTPIGLDNFVQERGQFSTTNIGFTSFKNSHAMFDELRSNAARIGNNMASSRNQNVSGYGMTNQDVMMQALLETYGTSNRSNPIRDIPLPNWTLTYSGLTNNRFLNKKFSRIDLTHAYRSNYTANGIQSNLAYYEYEKGTNSNPLDLNGSYKTSTVYDDITFIETFAPLLGLDMTFRNNLQMRFMYNRDRIQSFSFNNYSLTDQQSNEFVFGLGYVFKDLKMKMRFRGKKKTLTSDLNLRTDLIIRDTETSILRVVEDDAQITAGDKQFTLKTTADYNFSKNFNLMFFYNHLITTYKISTAYPITDIRAGITARFSFGN
ncbi:MAG: cell surface protein SprA [Flavobacteriales bacterium]